MHWRRKWQPTPVFLPGESQGQGSLVGCCLQGRRGSDTTEVTWQWTLGRAQREKDILCAISESFLQTQRLYFSVPGFQGATEQVHKENRKAGPLASDLSRRNFHGSHVARLLH